MPHDEATPRFEEAPRSCEQTLRLAPGRRVVHEPFGSEVCSYDFQLERDTFLELVVEQHGVDVILTLAEPGESRQIQVDSLNGAVGPESLSVVARRSGRHRLEIRSGLVAASGRYELRIETLRLATSEDRERDRAARIFSQAEERRRARKADAAEALYLEALNHWRAAEDNFHQAIVLGRIGSLYRSRREWRQALTWYQRSLEQFDVAGGSKRQVPKILNDVGSCHRKLGEWRSALASYDRARWFAESWGNRREEAASLNNAAIVYKSQGRFQLAIDHYERAIERWREAADPLEEAYTWVNVAWLYIGLGQPRTARSALDNAVGLVRRGSSGRVSHSRADLVEASALNALAKAQRQQGLLNDALASLRRCLELRRGLPGQPGLAMTLKGLGRTFFELNRLDQALQTYNQALELARSRGIRRIEGVLLNEMGWLYNEGFHQHEQALRYYRIAREIFRDTDNPKEEASSLYGISRVLRSRGELVSALSRIEEALEIIESLRAEPDDPKDRAYFLADKQHYYELTIDLLIGLHERNPAAGHAARALEVSEYRRARALLDVLNASLVEQEMEQTLRRSRDTTQVSIDPEQDGFWPPPTLSAQQPVLLSFGEIRQMLDEGTLLLEYSLGESRSFLWLVSSNSLEVHELPPRSQIKALAKLTYGRLSKSYNRSSRGAMRWATDQLGRLLLEPVADRLGTKRLLVVSGESLQYVPFGAFPYSSANAQGPESRSRYLVERHEIVYLPSLSVLSLLRRKMETQTPASKPVAVMADPVFARHDPRVADIPRAVSSPPSEDSLALPRLALSREEADAILSFASENERFSAFGFDANKQTVLDGALADYRFVHFATHALFDQENPEVMGVALSRVDEFGRPRDWLLRPYEIYHLSLPVEMVTLSACQSGLGKEVLGEGLVGLTQSFFDAGAGRVVASFWRVDDRATAELMTEFYRAIFEDELRPAAALRVAQLAMLRDSRWRQAPYYWAGFFLQGEWR